MAHSKGEKNPMTDFKTWNKHIQKLTYNHNTFTVFQDYLNIIIDNYTIPDQKPLFTQTDRYTMDEHGVFTQLYHDQLVSMQEELETRDYCDFLGEWWESDQNLTNKNTEQYFTPPDICTMMCELLTLDTLDTRPRTMHDCCCGSGRFAMAYHHYRPQDWFFLVDIDEVAVKMTLINMLLHGMRGVVVHGNALTLKCYNVWVVSPSLFEYAGLPYIVPHEGDVGTALEYLPRESITPRAENDNGTNHVCGSTLDAWIRPAEEGC